MGTGPTTTVRIDPEVKKSANEIFEGIGISLSSAVNAFLKAVIREGGMPFDMKVSYKTTEHSSGNISLNHAYMMKKDEFYTQYEDIAKEMAKYENAFNGKQVLCNCDDPFESSFFRYFVVNFEELGLKKLTSTCYAKSSLSGNEYPLEEANTAYVAEITNVGQDTLLRPDGSLDLESLFSSHGNTLRRLAGDGDFRSEECVALLEQADIVVTNPPFSLFREFINLLVHYKKKFIILGNLNASTCKEIFPLFRDNKIWYGETIRSGDRKFFVPDDYPLKAANCGVDSDGRRYIRVKGVRWFTNIENGRRHEALLLKSTFSPSRYPRYENYDAIDVKKTAEIPSDYYGYMGVPITFLDKYCPDQFEIVMLANGNARTNVDEDVLKSVNYCRHPEDRGGVGVLNGKRVYARIIIRRRGCDQ